MQWIMLIIAGLFEVGFAACLGKAKEASGNDYYLWFSGFLLCLGISMYLLVQATKVLPIGTAYAVWTGLGAAGTVIVGAYFFNEPLSMARLFFIATLVGSVIGLKVVS